ncbi:MAG: hypothetical protein P8N07_10785 [Flavobacteriales bacterium]|jgi:hypothetical protein|nr:hypothetical protein [Flavobacteriales bacterium]
MDYFEKFWLLVRKYLFSILLIIAGITFLIVGMSKGGSQANLAQSSNFTFAAIILLFLGAISLYFIMEKKIGKAITLISSLIFLLGAVIFIYLNISTVQNTVIQLRKIEESENLAKQGLSDIQKLQDAYERKNRKLATSFEELTTFAKSDSIKVLDKAIGDIPSRRMTVAEGRQLGYKYPKAVISEEEAIKLGLITRIYKMVPVADYTFSKEKDDKRLYDFELDKLNQMRQLDNTTKDFTVKAVAADSAFNVLFQAIPPYGPQDPANIKDTFQIGSLIEVNTKSNWK